MDNWLLLINLANGGMKAFQTEKRLRSAEFHHQQAYALYRLCNLLDDPPQTAVRSIIRRILQFRQCAIPRSPRPLVLPLLARQPFFLSAIRKKHYDIDGAAEAIWRHVHPDKEPPSKTSDSTLYTVVPAHD